MGKTKAQVLAEEKKVLKLVADLAALGVVGEASEGAVALAKKLAGAKKEAADAKRGALGGIKKNVDQVQVVDRNGDVIRKYSKKVHGADFLENAAEFAGKEEGRKVEEVD